MMTHKIQITGGGILMAVSLCLSVSCSLEKQARPPVPLPTAAARNQPPPTPAFPQPPAPPPAQPPAHAADHAAEANMPRVTGQEAIALVKAGKAVILDVRAVDNYRMEHPKGALSLPLQKIEQGDYKAMRADGTYIELPRDKRIISYCT